MARPSKVDRLPPEIRDAIGDLRRRGRTIDEILAHLRAMGVGEDEVSRTGLGKAVKKWDALAARLNDSRAAAEAIMSRLEAPDSDDRVARLNIQSLHASLMELMRGEDGEPPQLTPQEAMFVSATIKNLVSAAKVDQSRYFEIKKQLAAEQAKTERLKEAVRTAGKSGVTGDLISRFRVELGIDKGA
jgi:hypothetical protein